MAKNGSAERAMDVHMRSGNMYMEESNNLVHHEWKVTYRPRTTRTPPEEARSKRFLLSWRSGNAPSGLEMCNLLRNSAEQQVKIEKVNFRGGF